MNKKVILLVSFLAVVAILVFSFSQEHAEERHYTGEWYEVYYEIVSFDSDNPIKSKFDTGSYELEEKAYPITIDWIEGNMFSGSIEGAPVLGSHINGEISFDAKLPGDHYVHAEGFFKGHTLTLSLLYYSDVGMTKLGGGAHLKYVHESSGLLPSFDVIPSFDMLEVDEGVRDVYEFDGSSLEYAGTEHDRLNFVKTGFDVAIVESTLPGSSDGTPLYGIVVNKYDDNTGINYIMGSSSNDTSYVGWMHVADNKLQTILYPKGSSTMNCLISTYDVVFNKGIPTTVSGLDGYWKTAISYSFGEEIIHEQTRVTKHFEYCGHCFASMETSEGSDYTWMGTTYGIRIYIVAEYNGNCNLLTGVYIGDKIVASGTFLGENNEYRAICFNMEKESSVMENKTGDWFLYLEEHVSLDNPDAYTRQHYSPNENAPIFSFDQISNGLFTGNFDGNPVSGSLIGEFITFECKNSINNYFYYAEGTFERNALSLSIIYFKDEDMLEVSGGCFARLIHESAYMVIPAINAYMLFDNLNIRNGEGTAYHFDSNDNLVENSYVPEGIEIVSQGTYVSVLKSNIKQDLTDIDSTLYSVCVFKNGEKMTYAHLVGGSNSGKAYVGTLVLSANELLYSCYIRGGSSIAYSHAKYVVDYPFGHSLESSDLSGTWGGDCFLQMGDDYSKEDDVVKQIEYGGGVIYSCDVTEEGTVYWIGSSYASGVHMLASFEGETIFLSGIIKDNKIYLSGSLVLPDGSYASMYYVLTPQE